LARRANALQSIRQGIDEAPLLVLDAGNALLGYGTSYEQGGALTREAMDLMGYDAMAVGGVDLELGVAHLRSVADEAGFAVLSANLVSRDTGLPPFSPYVIIQRAGVRVGILGLTEDTALDQAPDAESYEVLAYDATLVAYIDDVAGQSDLVVLLSHVGLQDDKLLAETYDAIDVVIGGRNARRLLAPESVNGTPIVQLGARGEDLGRLEIALDGDNRPIASRWQVIALGPEFADDPEVASLVHRYRVAAQSPTSSTEAEAAD